MSLRAFQREFVLWCLYAAPKSLHLPVVRERLHGRSCHGVVASPPSAASVAGRLAHDMIVPGPRSCAYSRSSHVHDRSTGAGREGPEGGRTGLYSVWAVSCIARLYTRALYSCV